MTWMSVPARGWAVEVTHPDSGHVWRPDVVDAQRQPVANDFPRLRLTVRKSDAWRASAFEGATMRVWKDGSRQPIDTLETVEDNASQTVLEGRGGTELDDRHRREVKSEACHTLADTIVSNETTYTANVDAPNVTTETDQTIEDVDTQSEFEADFSLPSDVPVEITSGELSAVNVSFFEEGETWNANGLQEDSGASGTAGGAAAIWDTDGTQETETLGTAKYDVSDFRIGIRAQSPTGNGPALDFEVNGTSVFSTTEGSNFGSDWNWTNSGSGVSVSAGDTINLTITASDSSGSTDAHWIDCVVLYDEDYSYTFDNTVDSNNSLSGPEPKPDYVEVETDDTRTVKQIVAGELTSSWDDTSGQQTVAISNDGGQTWTSASNATSVSEDWSNNPSTRMRVRFGLSRYGSQTDSPTSGVNGQTVTDYKKKADLEDTPTVNDRTFDDSLMGVLQEIANVGDQVFEYRRNGSTESIEWTTPGQRTADRDDPISSFQSSKTVEEAIQKAVVKGGSRRQRDERFDANHGTAVGLDRSELLVGREVVYDPNSTEEFEHDIDYTIDYQAGTIETISTGTMTDGSEYAVDYEWRPVGEYTDSGAGSDPDEIVRDFPQAKTERACSQLALRLVEELNEPLEEIEVRIPADEVGWSVVEAIDYDELPGSGPYRINSIDHEPGETVLRLGTRQSISQAVSRLRSRVEAIGGEI